MTLHILAWGDMLGSTDSASILGIFSSREKAEAAADLEYDLGYHGKIRGTDEACAIYEATLDEPLLQAIRLI